MIYLSDVCVISLLFFCQACLLFACDRPMATYCSCTPYDTRHDTITTGVWGMWSSGDALDASPVRAYPEYIPGFAKQAGLFVDMWSSGDNLGASPIRGHPEYIPGFAINKQVGLFVELFLSRRWVFLATTAVRSCGCACESTRALGAGGLYSLCFRRVCAGVQPALATTWAACRFPLHPKKPLKN